MEQFKVLPVLLVFLLTAADVDGLFFHRGDCPQLSLQEDLNVTKYMGTWYEIETIAPQVENVKCNQATYSLLPNGTITYQRSGLMRNGKAYSIEGVAKFNDSSEPAILDISYFKYGSPARYWVLSTDYQSYALAYSCSDFSGMSLRIAWILSRTRVLTVNIKSKLHDELLAVGMNLKRLQYYNQTGCDPVKTT